MKERSYWFFVIGLLFMGFSLPNGLLFDISLDLVDFLKGIGLALIISSMILTQREFKQR